MPAISVGIIWKHLAGFFDETSGASGVDGLNFKL
jgi:hypothetical protein